jgi:hypothetical protein
MNREAANEADILHDDKRQEHSSPEVDPVSPHEGSYKPPKTSQKCLHVLHEYPSIPILVSHIRSLAKPTCM